jgi:MoxR-like ATPase
VTTEPPSDIEPTPSRPDPPATPAVTGADREDLTAAADLVREIRGEISKAVVGQDRVIDQVLTALLAGGHVLVEGVPGLGKTLLVLALARTFGGRFTRIQFTPDLMPTDVTGHALFDSASQKFRIRKGPAFTNLLLADEINRAPAKTQAALLEVMQERQVSIEGQPFEVPRPFMVLATQNPIEQEGTYPLPEAQMDRFLLKVDIDYPSEQEEIDLVGLVTSGRVGHELDVSAVSEVTSPERVLWLQEMTAKVLVDERIIAYAVRIVRATRSWRGLRIGAGPRGAISLVRASRAAALVAGRDFVVPDDLKGIALAALGHRVLMAPELEIEGQGPAQVIPALLDEVEAPRT